MVSPQHLEQLPQGEALFIDSLDLKIVHALSRLTDRKIKQNLHKLILRLAGDAPNDAGVSGTLRYAWGFASLIGTTNLFPVPSTKSQPGGRRPAWPDQSCRVEKPTFRQFTR